MNRFNFFSVQGVLCFRQVSTHNIQLKVWLKEVWNHWKYHQNGFRVSSCLTILKPSSHCYWINSTNTISVNFWLVSLFSYLWRTDYPFAIWNNDFLKVSFETSGTFQRYRFYFFRQLIAAVLSCLFVFLVRNDPHYPRFRVNKHSS